MSWCSGRSPSSTSLRRMASFRSMASLDGTVDETKEWHQHDVETADDAGTVLPITTSLGTRREVLERSRRVVAVVVIGRAAAATAAAGGRRAPTCRRRRRPIPNRRACPFGRGRGE